MQKVQRLVALMSDEQQVYQSTTAQQPSSGRGVLQYSVVYCTYTSYGTVAVIRVVMQKSVAIISHKS
jgi:hypothetical protein